MKPGQSLLIDGKPYEIIAFLETGDVHVEDVFTGERRWVDWYQVRAVHPHTSPGALLEALAELDPREDE